MAKDKRAPANQTPHPGTAGTGPSKPQPTELAEEKQPAPHPVSELMAQMAYEYSQQDTGWSMLRGRDRAGHTDTFISGPLALYQLKTEFKNPYQPIGAGVRFPNPRSEGLPGGRQPTRRQQRLFTPQTIEPLFAGEPFPFQEVYPRLVHDERKETLNLEAVVSAGVAARNQPSTDRLRHLISAGQDNLQARLKAQVDRLTRKHDMFREFG